MAELVDIIFEFFRKLDPIVFGTLVSLIFVTLCIFLIKVYAKGSKRTQIIFVGLSDAGKTLLLSQLAYGKYVSTHTSMKENFGLYRVGEKKKALQMVDIPGHERVRNKFIDQFKNFARAIIFVVDSSTFQKDYKDVAEYMYTLLSDSTVSKNLPPILVACNKQDQTISKGPKVIELQLQKEMNTLRVTRAAALGSTDGATHDRTLLGKKNKRFEFGDLKPMQIDFVECSAGSESQKPCLENVESWLTKIA